VWCDHFTCFFLMSLRPSLTDFAPVIVCTLGVIVTSIKQQNKNRASGGYSSSDFKRNHGPGAPAEPSACLLHNPHAKESASTRLDHPSSILVLHAELASVRALLELASVRALRQRPLSLQPPIHSRTCVRCTFPVACTYSNKNQKMQMQILTNTYRRRAHAHTRTHTQTPTQEHMHTTPSEY